jgi:hypothetical protein
MRKSDNISWPHPVLGNMDDVEGSFEVKISGAIKDQILNLKTKETIIDNEYFESLINDGKATIMYKLSCNSTLFMKVIETKLEHAIECSLLSNKLTIDVLIIAKEDINDYSDDSFHEDTKLGENKGVFRVKKGTVLGDAGALSIPLTNEYRKGISGIIEFQEGDPEEPMSIDADGPKIIIRFPSSPGSQNMVTTFTSGRKQYKSVFMNLFIIPALTEAFRVLIESKRENTYDEKIEELEWARIISDNLREEVNIHDSPYELAQEFLQEMTEKATGVSDRVPVVNAFNELY